MLNQNNRQYDVIVYGATGFTGQLVAEYIQQEHASNKDFKWAMAGRNLDKLKSVASSLKVSSEIDLIVADGSDQTSIDEMVAKAEVILTTVGPYQLYGETLVKSCCEQGKGYVDLCGEPVWMHDMIAKYQDLAKSTGAKIVFSCGFDSIPFDLGVFQLQQKIIAETGNPANYVKGRVRKMQGTFSGGTAASLKATLKAAFADPKVMEVLRNPYALALETPPVEQPNGDKPYFDEKLGSWATMFIMAAINTRNVHRSNQLLGQMYGNEFKYDEMLLTGPGEQGEKLAQIIAKDKSLASDEGPKPGEGPSKEERENGFYDVMFVAEDSQGKTHVTSVSGDLDPGYGSTSRMITESAICLVENFNSLAGGFYTTAPAFGNKLIDRLEKHAGLSFKIEA